jgi:pSer/pThr/pTyr-binding forkhead associated (FHA) protein
MSARLTISTEEGLILDSYLSSQPVRIGRAKDNSLRSEDRRTSRRHAIVRRLPDGNYEAEDLGSSFGTLLNGRSITKETLKHQDILRCGGLTLQFLSDNQPELDVEGSSSDPSIMSATLDNLFEARTQIRRLIDEQALLRIEVGTAQEAEDRAKRLRDEAQDEVERLHQIISGLRSELSALQNRFDELGTELRERRSVKNDEPVESDALKPQLVEAQRQAERHKARAVELEERDAARMVNELAQKKEVERLAEQIKQREQREIQLTQALKPSLVRISELSQELETMRIKLAQAEADLADAKSDGRRR